MLKNQRGFSAVEVILILIIVGLLGGVGYYVWSSNEKTKTTLDRAEQSSSVDVEQKSSKKYLVIKEKGVKFELTDKIKDAYYHISKDGYVYLSLHRYDNVKGFEGCTAKGGSDNDGSGLAALNNAKVGDDNIGSPFTKKELDDVIEDRGVKINDTYYWFESNSQAPCFDFDMFPERDPKVQEMYGLRGEIVTSGKTITENK
jgi:hypothetical protein